MTLSYFSYQHCKFCTIESDIGYKQCTRESKDACIIAVTLPHQIPKYVLPDVYMKELQAAKQANQSQSKPSPPKSSKYQKHITISHIGSTSPDLDSIIPSSNASPRSNQKTAFSKQKSIETFEIPEDAGQKSMQYLKGDRQNRSKTEAAQGKSIDSVNSGQKSSLMLNSGHDQKTLENSGRISTKHGSIDLRSSGESFNLKEQLPHSTAILDRAPSEEASQNKSNSRSLENSLGTMRSDYNWKSITQEPSVNDTIESRNSVRPKFDESARFFQKSQQDLDILDLDDANMQLSPLELQTQFTNFLCMLKDDEISKEKLLYWWIGNGQDPGKFEEFLQKLTRQGEITISSDGIALRQPKVMEMTETVMSSIENTLSKSFVYDENDPSTFKACSETMKQVQDYLNNPIVRLKRKSKKRLELLLGLGKYYYTYLGKPEIAIVPFQQAVDLASELFPTLQGHELLASTHDWVGKCNLLTGKHKESELHFQKAFEVRVGLYGKQSPEIAQTWHHLGNTAKSFGRDSLAEEFHQKALDIRKTQLGVKDPQLANSYDIVASTYIDKGLFMEALQMQQKAVEIRKAHFGENHPLVADLYVNIAGFYLAREKPDDAIEYLNKAMKIRTEVFGENHWTVALCQIQLAQLLMNNGEFVFAKDYLNSATQTMLASFGEAHPHVQNWKYLLEDIDNHILDSSKPQETDLPNTEAGTNRNTPALDNSQASQEKKSKSCCIIF